MAIRTSPEAESELDDIWYYIATESSSVEVAERMLDAINDQLALLSKHPLLGRSRDDLRPGLRSITVGAYVLLYRIEHEDVVILHVLQGRRDIRSVLQ
jgi:toxin ParE1/3/4